jgi:membrane protein insertase Oxa1/YidC/SpoIIIJ
MATDKDAVKNYVEIDMPFASSKEDALTPLSYYLDVLERFDPVMIPFLSAARKEKLRRDLLSIIKFANQQKLAEASAQKVENKKIYEAHVKKCEELLDALNPEKQKLSPEQAYFADGRPVKYCGIPLAKEFADKLVELADHKSRSTKEFLGKLNEKRLYWVWGSVFLKTVLSALPQSFYNTQQAGNVVKAPDPYTGTLSWALYYFRFSLNLFMLLKHTIKGPWMDKDSDEYKQTWQQRFLSQWSQRKFVLLNDSLWGTSNLLGFFWLNGKGALGTAGDAITIVLLVFDLLVTLWDFAEQQTQYNKQMEKFATEIDKINTQLSENERKQRGEQDQEDAARLKKEQIMLQLSLQDLKRAQKKCQREWMTKKIELCTNVAYAIGLMGAFVTLAMASAMSVTIVGAVLCFAFTVINNAIRGGLEISKARHALKEANEDFDEHIKNLKQMLLDKTGDDDAKKLLYLEIKKLDAETAYQRDMVVFKSMHLVRSILIESMIPAVVFACFVFLPLGIGLAALAGGLVLAIATNLLINALLEPDEKMKQLTEFDDAEYNEFCQEIKGEKDTSTKENNKAHHAFFKQKRAEYKAEHKVTNLPVHDDVLGNEDAPLIPTNGHYKSE